MTWPKCHSSYRYRREEDGRRYKKNRHMWTNEERTTIPQSIQKTSKVCSPSPSFELVHKSIVFLRIYTFLKIFFQSNKWTSKEKRILNNSDLHILHWCGGQQCYYTSTACHNHGPVKSKSHHAEQVSGRDTQMPALHVVWAKYSDNLTPLLTLSHKLWLWI